jgi:hypothetical protein
MITDCHVSGKWTRYKCALRHLKRHQENDVHESRVQLAEGNVPIHCKGPHPIHGGENAEDHSREDPDTIDEHSEDTIMDAGLRGS